MEVLKYSLTLHFTVASGGSAGGVKRLIERLGMKVLCGCFIFEAVMPEHRQSQRENLGDLDLHATLQISEETLTNMDLYDGKKDESGYYIGDGGPGGASGFESKEFQHY